MERPSRERVSPPEPPSERSFPGSLHGNPGQIWALAAGSTPVRPSGGEGASKRWLKVSIAGMALALGLGCADIQEARKVQDPDNRLPGEKTVTAADLGLRKGTVLTFDRGLEISLGNNPNIGIYRARILEALGGREQVDSAFYPLLSASSSYRLERAGGAGNTIGHTTSTLGQSIPVKSSIANSGVFQNQGGSTPLSLLIYDFDHTPGLSRQALGLWIAAKANLASAENDTVFNYKSAYFNVLKQEELVAVGVESVRDFQHHLEQTQVLVQVGLRQKYDLTKAQVDLGNAQLALVKARTALAAARATLNNALGLADDPGYVLDKPKPAKWSLPFDEAFPLALQSHPHLLSLLLMEQAARDAVDAAIGSFYPSIGLTGTFSWSGSLTPTTWLSYLGPLLQYAVFTGGNLTGVLHQMVGNLREAYATRAQEEQLVYLNLKNAFVQYEDAVESLKILTLTVKNAAEQLDLAQGRFLNGKASAVDLTDAEVALSTAKGNEVSSRWDLETAIAALEQAVGGKQFLK